MTFNLRPYQQNLKDGLYRSWAQGNRNVCLVSPTGSGKTVVMSSIAKDQTTPGVAIAHRTELVGQISLAMARMGIEHNIIGSSTTVSFCISQQISELGRKFYNPNALVTVGSVDTIKSRAKRLYQWSQQQTWWMVDECFVADTNVTMADGSLQTIDQVRVGDLVSCYDEDADAFAVKPVTRVFRNEAPPCLLRIATSHHVLYATSGHPFLTRRGWVEAGNLRDDDEIYATTVYSVRGAGERDHGAPEVSVAQDRADILYTDLRICAPGRQQGKTVAQVDCHAMFRVRENSEPQSESDVLLSTDRSRILQQRMFNRVSVNHLVCDNGGDQSETRESSHEREQPDGERHHAGKGVPATARDGTQTKDAWWQRQTTDTSRDGADRHARTVWFSTPGRGSDWVPEVYGSGALQDRLRKSQNQSGDRSGWPESYITVPSRIGRAQGCVFAWHRVESVQILKRDHHLVPGDGHVYNLEVADHHTYIANGVVVHNCHHLLQNNKWGGAVEMLPRARGVGVTATPVRADRKSLHADQGGVFHDMIVGPSMRDLINQGSLCDYRIFAPPQSIIMSEDDIGSSGDYKGAALRAKAHKSKIVGDVVQHYLKLAKGLRGITFTVDVEQAVELAEAFTAAGVPALAVSAKTPDSVRAESIRKFRAGSVLQLVNVDLFGEGFDVPAVEVVSMARPTMSYGLYVQQFGRALRTLGGKSHGIIIDHVGNVKAHGLPDAPRTWSLYAEERGKRVDRDDKVIPVTTCRQCFYAYEALRPDCPFCGYRPEPESRSRPEHVDGDLVELDPQTLAAMRGEIEQIDARLADPPIPDGVAPYVARGIKNKAKERIEAQQRLRDDIALWAGLCRHRGDNDSAIHRRFWHMFGTDILSAQKLKRADAEALSEQIRRQMK